MAKATAIAMFTGSVISKRITYWLAIFIMFFQPSFRICRIFVLLALRACQLICPLTAPRAVVVQKA